MAQIQGLGKSRPGRKLKLVLSAHAQIGSERAAIISGWCIREAMGTGLEVAGGVQVSALQKCVALATLLSL